MLIDKIKLIGVKEVCKICNFSEAYYKVLLLRRKLPGKKVSGRWIFIREDILEFQKQREKQAKTDKRVRLKK